MSLRHQLPRKMSRVIQSKPKSLSDFDSTNNHLSRFISLLLLTSERAWAHALYMKSLHSADSSAKAITGTTRRHIISRLHKAEAIAAHLVSLLDSNEQEDGSKVVLEARAYYCMMRGALEFESRKWEKCLEAYSEAHLLYTYFRKSSSAAQGDILNELLSNTVDPSIRYAAYQLRLPRTLSISKIVSQFLPKDSPYATGVIEENPDILKEGSRDAKVELDGEVKDLPKTITWRNRTVNLEDANIAQALAAVRVAEQKLNAVQKSSPDTSIKESAAAYDDVLSSSQDAVDSTNTAISELSADGIAQDDSRMQALQITRTAVNYALVGWRIGRNRVLCGTDDGIHPDFGLKKKASRARKNGKPTIANESNVKKLALFRERVTLYDTIIQSLDSVKELPGVAADQSLLGELNIQRSYFAALRYELGKNEPWWKLTYADVSL
jgi:signal recognition particle subunit SRP68